MSIQRVLQMGIALATVVGCSSHGGMTTKKPADASADGPASASDLAIVLADAEVPDGKSMFPDDAMDAREDSLATDFAAPWIADAEPDTNITPVDLATGTATDGHGAEIAIPALDALASEVGCDQPPSECSDHGQCGQPCCASPSIRFNPHCAGDGLQYVTCADGKWLATTMWDTSSCGPPKP